MKRTAGIALAAILAIGTAAPGLAQTEQEGLVNINVEGVQIAVPIAVAAQVCGIEVAILQDASESEESVECEQGDLNDPVLQQYRT